jgi:nitrogen-specific signal transduction histidine kinase
LPDSINREGYSTDSLFVTEVLVVIMEGGPIQQDKVKVERGCRLNRRIADVYSSSRRGVPLSFQDNGPGIPDSQRARTNGWTSGSGLGLGLPGAKRLVNEFEPTPSLVA